MKMAETKKTQTLKELVAWAEERAHKYKGPKEETDHDLIADDVSRNGTTLIKKKNRKK